MDKISEKSVINEVALELINIYNKANNTKWNTNTQLSHGVLGMKSSKEVVKMLYELVIKSIEKRSKIDIKSEITNHWADNNNLICELKPLKNPTNPKH